MTAAEYFKEVEGKMAASPEKLDGLKGKFVLDLTPSNDGIWSYTFDGVGKNATITEGDIGSADLKVILEFETLQDIVAGKMTPQGALLKRKLKFKGNMAKGAVLGKIFEL
jgi:putative sterol carrier protein